MCNIIKKAWFKYQPGAVKVIFGAVTRIRPWRIEGFLKGLDKIWIITDKSSGQKW